MNIVFNIKKIADNEGITVTALEAKIGASKGVLTRSIANNTDIQAKWIVKIAENYPQYNPRWLLTGQGNMLLKDENPAPPTVITVDTQGNENIIFVPVKASAGYLTGYADPEYMHQLPAYRMPGISNGVFRMFEISGQSMQETLEDGDKVVGEWILPADIKDGQVYIVVSKADGICIKRCINRLDSDNRLILQSDNKEFADITINHEDILEVWSVKLRITRKVNNPSINRVTENAEDVKGVWNAILKLAQKINEPLETNNRIADLEAHLTFLEQSRLNKP